MENLLRLLTMENITLALSIIGAAGTFISSFYKLVLNRTKIKVRIAGQLLEPDSAILYVLFENHSRLSISLTSISLKIEGISHPCTEIPTTVLENTIRAGKDIISHSKFQTIQIPIFIPALGSTSGYIFFELPEAVLQSNTTHLNFLISTNRKKIVQMKLSLGRPLD